MTYTNIYPHNMDLSEALDNVKTSLNIPKR